MRASTIQAVRGMNDILPAATPHWRRIEAALGAVLLRHGYHEIRLPLVEKTELFKRSIGEVTDIVEKEMYSFTDRGDDALSLRPEGTAGCVRAALQSGIIHQGVQRLWYAGPMFRRERPQRGRYRQFHQIGAEVFGPPGPDIDAELIVMTARFWKTLGLGGVGLRVNSLGSPRCRAGYRAALVDYFQQHHAQLDADSRRRLGTNPLRILDSKVPQTRALLEDAPRISAYLDADARRHYDGLRERLDAVGVEYTTDETLVRGLDYYSYTVFEWVTHDLGAQGTVCAGGRYDGLVELLGGKPTPAAGFALGLERLAELLPEHAAVSAAAPDVYLIAVGEATQTPLLRLAEQLRDQAAGVTILAHCGGGSLKSQLKKADKSQARIAVILGEEEYNAGHVAVKLLRDAAAPQQTIPHERLAATLQRLLAATNTE